MRGRHARKKRARFAEIIIALCLLVSLIITGATVWEYHRLNTVMPSGVVSALLVLWGGELLIIAVRQIFGSDVITQAKAPAKNEEESI